MKILSNKDFLERKNPVSQNAGFLHLESILTMFLQKRLFQAYA